MAICAIFCRLLRSQGVSSLLSNRAVRKEFLAPGVILPEDGAIENLRYLFLHSILLNLLAVFIEEELRIGEAGAQDALIAVLYRLEVFLATVADRDKAEATELAKGFIELGYHIAATGGTGKYFKEHGVECTVVNKIHEGADNCADLIRQGKVDLMLNTLTAGKRPERDGFQLRRLAVEMGTPCLTSLDTAREVLRVVANRAHNEVGVEVEALQDYEME